MDSRDSAGQYIQVVVDISGMKVSPALSIDPWSNCPSEAAREEGCTCNECEFWAGEIRGVDWHEFSLCLFDGQSFL